MLVKMVGFLFLVFIAGFFLKIREELRDTNTIQPLTLGKVATGSIFMVATLIVLK